MYASSFFPLLSFTLLAFCATWASFFLTLHFLLDLCFHDNSFGIVGHPPSTSPSEAQIASSLSRKKVSIQFLRMGRIVTIISYNPKHTNRCRGSITMLKCRRLSSLVDRYTMIVAPSIVPVFCKTKNNTCG